MDKREYKKLITSIHFFAIIINILFQMMLDYKVHYKKGKIMLKRQVRQYHGRW